MSVGCGGRLAGARTAKPVPRSRRLSLEAASAYRVFANDLPHRPCRAARADSPVALAGLDDPEAGPHRVAVPDLSQLGYHLLGGRVLAVMYGPAAMLVYEDSQHNRITVYIQPMRRGQETPMRSVDAGAVDGYAWINRQIGYSRDVRRRPGPAPLDSEPRCGTASVCRLSRR